MLATIDSALPVFAGLTGEHEPLTHVGAEHVEPLVAVEVARGATFETAGVSGMSGMRQAACA